MKELYFVNSVQPGQRSNVEEAKEIKRHVRKAVLKNRGASDITGRIRQFSMVSCLGRGP
jgi:hypothetical protein